MNKASDLFLKIRHLLLYMTIFFDNFSILNIIYISHCVYINLLKWKTYIFIFGILYVVSEIVINRR
jgi:hypothetical protein